MSSAIDSKADFRARAEQIGVTTAVLDLLELGGVTSYGSFAFITPYQPGQPDETPLITALNRVMGRDPTIAEQIGLRRLFFESVTLAINGRSVTIRQSRVGSRLLSAIRDWRTRRGGWWDCILARNPNHHIS